MSTCDWTKAISLGQTDSDFFYSSRMLWAGKRRYMLHNLPLPKKEKQTTSHELGPWWDDLYLSNPASRYFQILPFNTDPTVEIRWVFERSVLYGQSWLLHQVRWHGCQKSLASQDYTLGIPSFQIGRKIFSLVTFEIFHKKDISEVEEQYHWNLILTEIEVGDLQCLSCALDEKESDFKTTGRSAENHCFKRHWAIWAFTMVARFFCAIPSCKDSFLLGLKSGVALKSPQSSAFSFRGGFKKPPVLLGFLKLWSYPPEK